MAISKNDCILLLTELKEAGIDTKEVEKELLTTKGISFDVLNFINKRRSLDVVNFYEKIRKSYNSKHSKLYGNIMKEVDNPVKVLSTLSSLSLQILLFSENVNDKELFFKHTRAREINLVLTRYFTDYDLSKALTLLRLIKADLTAYEVINERRQAG